MSWWNFEPKPSVYERRQRAAREAKLLAKRLGATGRKPSPVVIEGRTIARSFWGKAWCENLESYRDYEYRLPRGRSYVRSGAVLHLDVAAGKIAAVVCGTELYDVDIRIKTVAHARWDRIKSQCAGQIGSLIELLEGRLSDQVMRIITHREQGLFPKPTEIEMSCSCPDVATMCKHVAAAMYGVGSRLDEEPQMLFALRKVDHHDLLGAAAELGASRKRSGRKALRPEELGSVFGIELAEPSPSPPSKRKASITRPRRARKTSRRRGKTIGS